MKKSLPSIGIDKKKDIFESLDQLMKEAEKNQEKAIRKEFECLVLATVRLCEQLGKAQLILEAERVFTGMKGRGTAIDSDKLEAVVKVINEYVVDNEHILLGEAEDTQKMGVYAGEMLGEEVAQVKAEMRPLYFGLKNLILKEIESMDKEVDIQKFFFGTVAEEPQLGISAASSNLKQMISPMQDVTPEQVESSTTFTNVVKKIANKQKQETASKYQNSVSKSGMTPSEKKITLLTTLDQPPYSRVGPSLLKPELAAIGKP